MGNAASKDIEEEKVRTPTESRSRRNSSRSVMSSRFSISSTNTMNALWNHSTSDNVVNSESNVNNKYRHGLLDRIKYSRKVCKSDDGSSSISTTKHRSPIMNVFSKDNSSLDDPRRTPSPITALPYASTQSLDEIALIEKYTDSQMNLISQKQQQNQKVYSNNNSIMNKSNTSLLPVSSEHCNSCSNSTIDTNTSLSLSNDDTITYANQDINTTYSSEILLKELYMLSETSPERRRDRDRRHRQHYLLKRTWGSNYKVPLKDPSLIINWCCATAVWGVELAFEFPNAKVVGIDYQAATVSSITNTAKNFSFHNAMIHQGETGLEEFEDNQADFVMMRDVWLVNSPISKWASILQEIFRILKPGGYIEIYGQDSNFKSMGPYFAILEKWSDRFYETIKLDRNTNTQLGLFLKDAGYTNVVEESIELPIGEWPESKESKETGYLQKDLTERRFREAKRWYCKFNNISEREYTDVLNKAIDECDTHNTSICSLYFSAQKPTK